MVNSCQPITCLQLRQQGGDFLCLPVTVDATTIPKFRTDTRVSIIAAAATVTGDLGARVAGSKGAVAVCRAVTGRGAAG
jgi:hypothetical protein